MGLEKAIEHGKEHRKPYRGSRRFDALCRNHGACGYCKGNRTHNLEKAAKFAEEDIELAKKANDFEKEHGWCPDYGYEVFEEAINEKPMVKQKYELHVICPHCEKECDVPILVTTDDENINDALSLLCSFGVRGRKKEGNEKI